MEQLINKVQQGVYVNSDWLKTARGCCNILKIYNIFYCNIINNNINNYSIEIGQIDSIEFSSIFCEK